MGQVLKPVYRIPLLAVDGGGTKCLAVFVDSEGNVWGEGKAGSCNYQGVGREAVIRELIEAIRGAIGEISLKREPTCENMEWEVDCAVFALAGLDTEFDRNVIRALVEEVLNRLQIRVQSLIVENDGFAALLGATDGGPGILIIAGTGSIIYGINEQGVSARAGGWGHRVGDEGSGYWIGKQAITAILKAEDGRGKPTRLGEWIIPHLGLSNAEDLYNWVYHADYSVDKAAELSRMVSIAMAKGDEVSRELLVAAADELFEGACAVIRKLNMRNTPFKIVLQGGVLQNDDFIHQALIEKFRAFTPLAVPDKARKEPIYGVIAMGLSYMKQR
ncbi:N-acetylglucosamine kinase [Paenibacillus sp. MBLB4367]|uniref:N-acetylglucosamine kinase n=1 Tax=Paenibacillus sp. MBLB4367 TaxID=3384767 RepID=UPI0039083C6F